MSMIGNYLRLPQAELDQVLDDPVLIMELLYPDDDAAFPTDQHLDIDKSWQLIHFLLTDDPWKGEVPLCNAVLGGDEIGSEDVGYGPARWLNAAMVSKVSSALATISAEELWSRFDRKAAAVEEIYPAGWKGDDQDRMYVLGHYEALRLFFAKAAASDETVVLYIN